MDFSITTRTPLWAASAQKGGRQDRLHESGIIGSLRWWYEVILRGLGADVCDPTSNDPKKRCPRDSSNPNDICKVCKLFGCTGHRRQFRLTLDGGLPRFVDNDRTLRQDSIALPSGRIKGSPENRSPGGWFFQRDSWIGDRESPLAMQITPLGLSAQEEVLRVLLAVISKHASLGAKVSNGCGVVDIQENGKPLAVSVSNLDRLPRGNLITPTEFPDLRDFFFAKLQFSEPSVNADWWRCIQGITEALAGQVTQNGETVNVFDRRNTIRNDRLRDLADTRLSMLIRAGLLPLAPAVRNWLRFKWPNRPTGGQANFLFGTSDKVCLHCYSAIRRNGPTCQCWIANGAEIERSASKVNVSHAYKIDDKWEFRIWGWIPGKLPINLVHGITGAQFRDDFLNKLEKAFHDTTISKWRETTSIPPPSLVGNKIIRCSDNDGPAYLKQLLGLDQEGS